MSEKVLTKIGGINIPRYKLLVKVGTYNLSGNPYPVWNTRDYRLFSGTTDGEVLLPRTGYRMLNNLEHKINPFYIIELSTGGRYPAGKYGSIACKESIIDYLVGSKSFTLTLKAPFSKLELSRFKKWVQNKTNITVDNEKIVCDGWWETEYRLGWLMMAVRVAQGNFSNLTETFIKRFEEFIAGDYSNEVPMTPYQNWETKYNL